MASEWRTRRFEDCAVLVRETVSPADVAGAPYVGLEHIAEGALQLAGVGSAADVTSAKSRFRAGDILFGKLRPYFRKIVRAPFDGVCSTDIWVVRPRGGMDAAFLFYWMASQDFVDTAVRGSEGTRMPRAKWDFVGKISQPVPSVTEQRRIARTLSAFDHKIELNRRMNETLQAIVRAIFQSWFVDFDPVRAKAEGHDSGLPRHLSDLFPDTFEDSESGHVPSGWEVRGLDEIADYLNGLALQKYPPADGRTLPVVKIAQLKKGSTDGADLCSADVPERFVVKDGDVLFSWSGSLAITLWCGGDGALNQHLFKITSSDMPKWFYYLWTAHHLPHFQSIAAGKATTMGHIQRHHLSDAKAVVPPKPLIAAMDEALSPLLERVIANGVQNQTLAALRDALLPKLMSGEIRLNAAPEDVHTE